MKKYLKLGILLLTLVIFIKNPLYPFVKSFTIMAAYSWSEERNSLLKKENIKIDIPGGITTMKKDYFPFVMTFNDSVGFSDYISESVALSVLYNFGAFEYSKGASSYYNSSSNYFNSFYGAYIVKGEERPYGFSEDGRANYDEIAKIAEYDVKTLVLESIGCENPQFDFSIEKETTQSEFLGYSDWTVIDANIITNSPIHAYLNNYQAYIQYGKPPKEYYDGQDFPLIEQKGKILGKYFKEKECAIFFYVLAQDKATIEETFENFLMKTSFDLNVTI